LVAILAWELLGACVILDFVSEMSDEDRDVDIESDDDDDGQLTGSTAHLSQAEKRAHHNALERKRRDHIKESFHGLRDSVPALNGEKGSASRAQILKQATDYIQFMTKKNGSHQTDIDSLRRQNNILETQVSSTVRALEKAKAAGSFAAMGAVDNSLSTSTGGKKKPLTSESASDSESYSDTEKQSPAKSKRKKLKTWSGMWA